MNAPFQLTASAALVELRPYQRQFVADIDTAWEKARRVMGVLATGLGKTRVMSYIFGRHVGAGMLVAHRQELVGQIAEALNSAGLRFRILAPKKVIQIILRILLRKHGVCHYDPSADLGVAGIDTLLRTPTSTTGKAHRSWLARVTLAAIDEAHHVLRENKWGKGVALLSDTCRWFFPTASPCRGDGRGLGIESDGLADALVLGPGCGEGIEMGYLTPFKVVCAKVSVDYDKVDIGASGEYVQAKLVAAEEQSGLLGDIVETYRKHTPGKRGVVFVASIKQARELAERFTAAGFPALALDGTSDDDLRNDAKQDLETGKLKLLVNVDLFGEGFDLPAIEVAILGTKTLSLSRFLQWCGRVLRLVVDFTGFDALTDEGRRARIAASLKPFGIIIDHGGNLIHHGLPDKPHLWTLDASSGADSGPSDAPGLRACTNPGIDLVRPEIGWAAWRKAGWTNEQMIEHGHARPNHPTEPVPCAQPYAAHKRVCEYCGYMPEPKGRRLPEQVEGDLEMLDDETMAELRASYAQARQTIEQFRSAIAARTDKRMSHMMAEAAVNHHRRALAELAELDAAMGRFGGRYRERGEDNAAIQRRFFKAFGIDVLTAASLKRAEAEKLRGRIDSYLSAA